MLTALTLSLAFTAAAWYGPVTVEFDFAVSGNPYDPEANSVVVRFTPESGEPLDRLAYYDQGKWKATLLSPKPGDFQARLIHNGRMPNLPAKSVVISEKMRPAHGFVSIDPARKTRFIRDDRPFFPLGINLGWQTPGLPDMTAQLGKMADSGMNWARIWACHWDGKNPYWPNVETNLERGYMWPQALSRWDQLVAASEKHGIAFQMVLFHHGQVSSTVNSNWDINPWNKANGGFLESPVDFFRHPEAKRLARAWLRYAVARWGHSSSIMAWELFNEIEWVDAWRDGPREIVYAWHKEMADYLRELDPYGRLVTTSSEMAHPELWAAMDYYQPHGYPPSVFNMVAGAEVPKDKPYFWGEFGPGGSSGQPVNEAVRDGLWASIMKGHSGAAQYWYWDIVERDNLYPEFKRAHTALVALSGGRAALSPSATPFDVQVMSEARADLVFRPGRGWGKTERHVFQLPEEATPEKLAQLSEFLNSHTGGNRELNPEPLVLRFRLETPGEVTFTFGQVARNGAKVQIAVNGKTEFERAWEAGEGDRSAQATATIPLAPGDNEVRLSSVGTDWVTLSSIRITGAAPAVRALAIRDYGKVMLRLTRMPGAPSGPIDLRLTGLGLDDAQVTVQTLDLETGEAGTTRVDYRNGEGAYRLNGKDVVLILS